MMKNIKKYLKLHLEKRESSFQTQGCYYPPASWEEFERWNESTFDQNFSKCSDDDSILTTKIYISLFDNLKDFAFYSVFKDLDFEKLNNALFQTSREELLKTCIFPSGTDHCHAFFESLSAFACNDFEVIESLFPAELPSGAGRYYTENAVNLLKILYFGQEDLKEEALRKAEKFLQKKKTAWERLCVLYLLALMEKNAEKASECLQELCAAYQKLGFPREKTDKLFAQEIHGLYRLARTVDADLFEKITMPVHDCFFREFEHWQRENGYPKGRIFYFYPPKMAYMNAVLQAQLPKMTLYEQKYDDGRRYIYKNVEKFASDLTEEVQKTTL
ncbi:Uncharacterised protein [Kingella potus]|uniref:Uncharacterized protein n=1 Tax=Kingella potus TaxID=265175 RepID=A0A377R2C4_9NEIS|nr:hypothetical protein [Kingella potus]STR00908.1 Uncharacterised protein [Kingella potus]